MTTAKMLVLGWLRQACAAREVRCGMAPSRVVLVCRGLAVGRLLRRVCDAMPVSPPRDAVADSVRSSDATGPRAQ